MFAPFADRINAAPIYRDVDAETLAAEEPEPYTARDILRADWPALLRDLLSLRLPDEAVA